MSNLEEPFETKLRQLLVDTSEQVHPTRAMPVDGWLGDRTHGRNKPPVPRILALAFVCVLAVAVVLAVSLSNKSNARAAGSEISGSLVAVQASGAVVVMDPNTGDVERTLVGAHSDVVSGRHLSLPFAVDGGGGYAYISYIEGLTSSSPSQLIYRVPLSGGTLTYVTDGIYPSVSPSGSELAYVRIAGDSSDSSIGATEQVVVRSTLTGKVIHVYAPSALTVINDLSWSPDGIQLLISGLELPNSTSRGAVAAVELLHLDRPQSSVNPRTLISSDVRTGGADLSDGQFLASGSVALLRTGAFSQCVNGPTEVVVVNPVSGIERVTATVPFFAADADFESSRLVILDGIEFSCPASSTTTTPTMRPGRNTSSTIPMQTIAGSVTTGGVSTYSADRDLILYKWESGKAVRIATGITASTLVP